VKVLGDLSFTVQEKTSPELAFSRSGVLRASYVARSSRNIDRRRTDVRI
jgi:hypothetical protein